MFMFFFLWDCSPFKWAYGHIFRRKLFVSGRDKLNFNAQDPCHFHNLFFQVFLPQFSAYIFLGFPTNVFKGPFFQWFFRSKESEHAGMKKRLARLAELSREQSQTAQENLKLAQDSARLGRETGKQNRNGQRFLDVFWIPGCKNFFGNGEKHTSTGAICVLTK